MQFNVEIKICGINSFESAKASIGAEYIGFVFYQKSPRFLNAFDAKEIATYLNPNQKKVGLFVNADINVIKHISEFVNLDMIQLHGDESINDIKAIKNMIKKPIIKALPVSTYKDVKNSKKIEYLSVHVFLLFRNFFFNVNTSISCIYSNQKDLSVPMFISVYS